MQDHLFGKILGAFPDSRVSNRYQVAEESQNDKCNGRIEAATKKTENENISLGLGDKIFAPNGNDQKVYSQDGKLTKETHKQSYEQRRELEAGKGLFFELVVFFFGITGGDQRFADIRECAKGDSLEDFVAKRHDI